MSKDTPEQLEAAMAALQAQRSVLGDAVVDTALLALRQQLAAQRAAAPTLPAQQLKQVSVLFVDVVGSTAIGQRLTPEDISAVMDGALARFTAIVQAHHGRVLQYTGDGMLAAFGTEVAHEDDVEAAVHAGLGIIDEARHAAPQVCSTHGVADFNVRVGIHTGRVLLGAGVDAEGSIRGAAVNLAARMEQTAPPGRLRISQDTYRHVNGLFDLVEQPPVLVKGVAEPVRGYLVERARPRALRVSTRGVEGVPTPMIGRDAELAQLLAAVDAVCAARRLCTVTVVGEAGLGKSRLVAEFQRALADQPLRCWLLPGRAHPRSALHPCGLLRDLFAGQLQIADDDSAETARSKFATGLGPLFDAADAADAADGAGSEATMHLLGHLIGLDYSASPHLKDCLHDDALLRQRGFAAAALCLRRLGRHRGVPVVLLLDDLHWADAGSLDFVQHLLQHEHDQPLLCLLLTRPALLEADARFAPPSGAADKPRGSHRWIELKPLGPANSRALADMLLQQVADVPAAMHTLLTSHAEGNPFYMEELVKMLLDDGVIVAEPQGWRVLPDKLVIAHVPQTLTGVLQARLDALAPAERTALQQAAIVGHLFSEATLAAIDPAAVNQLPVLLRKQLVRRAAQVFGETREYAFGHHLLHQVTEDSVLRDVKLRGHARVGAFWCARAEVAGPQDVDPAACRALAEAHDHCR
ncbi:adenylate/guanylate cyclase domain-containing protein, partial [Aquabacterium sp.]|uniref:adenylate/guanylate cyclase domain-containing protein n=1 Tax=Aquabacterium sp. TaxID=1872578 RepID=UPI002B5E1CAC